ncbi:hypothetical protein DBA29_00675 [Xenophilus aerolatus]|nr:hypothetical protein [Xenophilus aerolatus]
MRRKLIIECTILAFAVPVAIGWLSDRPGLKNLDEVIYDRLVASMRPAPSKDILIVSIDHRSLEELGPWPWPRSWHATLLQQLEPHAPRSVFLDIFMDAPGPPADNAKLARAMQGVPVFLPMRPHEDPQFDSTLVPPEPVLARNAAGMGHASVTVDDDRVVRRMYRFEGPPGALEPYVGLALLGNKQDARTAEKSASKLRHGWKAQGEFGFPVSGPSGTYRSVPYVSVLLGAVSDEFLRGKDIFVGPESNTGLDHSWAVAGLKAGERLDSVELHANAITALRDGSTIADLPSVHRYGWVTMPIVFVIFLFFKLGRHGFAGAAATMVGVSLFSYLALTRFNLWLPPAAPVVGVLSAYVLWSWRRLALVAAYLQDRVARLNAIPIGPYPPAAFVPRPHVDAVGDQTRDLDIAISRLASLQSFLSAGLRELPVAAVVCNEEGKIHRSNAASWSLLVEGAEPDGGSEAEDPLAGVHLPELLKGFQRNPPADALQGWNSEAEYTTKTGRIFNLRAAAFTDQQETSGWIGVMRELTMEKKSEQERALWLRFLSHDLRSPQVNILSLLALHQGRNAEPSVQRLLDSITREVERTLELSEGFMDLSHAESGNYVLAEVHAASVAQEAVDQVWPYANAKSIAVDIRIGDDEVYVHADGALLTRALVNLLSNALRHSPPNSTLGLCLASTAREVIFSVHDEGEGMDVDTLETLRTGRARSGLGNTGKTDEITAKVKPRGLGMAVVRAVVQRHRGWLEGWSAPGAGTSFFIGLPRHEFGPAHAEERYSASRYLEL